MGSKSDPPPPPDYRAAAQEQGQSSIANTRLAAQLNRPTVNTPLGSQTWSQPSPDQYQQDINLTPAGTQLLNTGLKTQQMMGDVGQEQLGRASEALSKPVDLSTVGGGSQQQIQDALYQRQSQYLDPQFNIAEDKERQRLADQGFQVGNEGYTRAMDTFGLQKQRAYSDARTQAIVGGQQARQQAIQEALLQRQTPLNEVNALRTGSQVQMPQFQATQGVTPPDPTQYLAATGQQGQYNLGTYNAQVAQQNALTSGLLGIGAAGAYGWAGA